MSYSSAQYQQFEEEEKAHKLKKRGTSDYDSQTRYMARKGHREAYEQLEKDEAEYQESEPSKSSKQRKTISVSHYTPETINPKSVKIPKIKDTKERFEKRKEQREGKSFREAAADLGGYVADNIKKGMKGKPKPEREPETARQETVRDNDTIRTVSKALTTRSQELRNIEEGAYKKQNSIEKGKRTAKENAAAARKGQLKAMPVWDRTVEQVSDITQVPIDVKKALEEAQNKIMHTQGRPKKQLTNNVKQAQPKQRVLTAAQKRALEAQVAKAAKNISPKPRRGSPFAVEKKTLTVTHHTLALTQPSPSSITGKSSSGNPFGGKPRGNPFATNKGNPLGSRRSGNPFETKKRGWKL